MIKLLYPLIYLERIYYTESNPDFKEQILSMALAKAKAMNLQVATHEKQGKVIPKIFSRGSSAPFEYSDGAIGIYKNGVYEIKDAYLLR